MAGERGGAVDVDEPPLPLWLLELLLAALEAEWLLELLPDAEPVVVPAAAAAAAAADDWLLKSHPVGRSSNDPDRSWGEGRIAMQNGRVTV